MTDSHQAADAAIANLRRRGVLIVADTVACESGIPLYLLLGRSRGKSVSLARRALYRSLRLRGLSLPEIGSLLNRDHTTILAGLRPLGSRKAGLKPSTSAEHLRKLEPLAELPEKPWCPECEHDTNTYTHANHCAVGIMANEDAIQIIRGLLEAAG